MSDAAINSGVGGPKLDPESLVLRARPRPVARFKRHVVIGVLAIAAIGIFVATWLALKASPLAKPTSGGELYNIDRKPTADGLAGLPSGYDKIRPALGPPLPGDIGPAELRARNGLGVPVAGAALKTTRPAPRNCTWPSSPGKPARETCSSRPGQATPDRLTPRLPVWADHRWRRKERQLPTLGSLWTLCAIPVTRSASSISSTRRTRATSTTRTAFRTRFHHIKL